MKFEADNSIFLLPVEQLSLASIRKHKELVIYSNLCTSRKSPQTCSDVLTHLHNFENVVVVLLEYTVWLVYSVESLK